MSADDLRAAVLRYRNARPVMRRPMRDSAEQLGLSLSKERNEAMRLLDKRWAWCDANAGHPQFAEREEALIGLLHEYEAMEDALRDAATALYGEVA